MGARGPKSDAAMRREWSLICTAIQRNSGLSAPEAEHYFRVGTGSGRLWRYWTAGEKLARAYQREAIIQLAREEGLLTAANLAIIKKTVAGADVDLLPDLDVPDIPEGLFSCCEEAAIALWQYLRQAKHQRFVRSALVIHGLLDEYEAKADALRAQLAEKLETDEMMVLAWIKKSYKNKLNRAFQ